MHCRLDRVFVWVSLNVWSTAVSEVRRLGAQARIILSKMEQSHHNVSKYKFPQTKVFGQNKTKRILYLSEHSFVHTNLKRKPFYKLALSWIVSLFPKKKKRVLFFFQSSFVAKTKNFLLIFFFVARFFLREI